VNHLWRDPRRDITPNPCPISQLAARRAALTQESITWDSLFRSSTGCRLAIQRGSGFGYGHAPMN
jgi:hypothetical protein